MQTRLADEQISAVFVKFLQQKDLIDTGDTAVIFYDLSFLNESVQDLVATFPATTLHAVAIKANPLQKILNKIKTRDVGVEAATLPELHLAIGAGFTADKIVFDSPAKTIAELEFALHAGIHVNADSFAELERIDAILRQKPSTSTIGLRINPQVGTGKILATSVAGDYSKFGVPLNDYRHEIKEAFWRYDWLRGVHVHIGSQGCQVEMLISGIAKVLDLVHEINAELHAQQKPGKIHLFDLGGGLPVAYHRDEVPVSLGRYKDELEARCPELFTTEFKLMTEFGRNIYANTGWVASRVEYVKPGKNIHTAMLHVGADLFLRECYNPQDWHHEMLVADRTGRIKSGLDKQRYVLAGPLCFAGDVLAREITLPKIEAEDWVIIQDTGAYTLSMWSRYNSRQIPKVIGYYDEGAAFEILKAREPLEHVLRFWA